MLLVQLSDLHVRPPGLLYKGVVDSNANLIEAIDHVHALDHRPDVALVTGDLVDEGRPEEYQQARRLLDRLDIPYFVIPGNHDSRDHLRAAFADHGYLPPTGPLHYCVDDYPVRIVGLDTSIPGKHHGHIEDDCLTWLSTVLEQGREQPTLVMLHHPPFVCGIPYLDQYRYMAAGPLEHIIAHFPQVESVICGHVHRSMLRRWGGTVVCSCPSTTTEIDLQLQADAEPRSHAGPRGCMLHLWEQSRGIVSHTSFIGSYDGPYPFA